MVHLSLVCLLKNDKNGSFRTATLTSAPSLEKLHDIYHQNIKTLDYMIKFCKKNKISSYRVSSSMFPLSTHPKYQDKTLPILESALREAKKIDFSGIHLSLHPDQFILLSSLNKEVNASSRYDLNLSAYIASFIPIKLINIHVGSKNKGFAEHKKIFDSEFSKLDNKTKKLLSLENDEKSYSFSEILNICQENNIMPVADFHHQRCHKARKNLLDDTFTDFSVIDQEIFEAIPEIIKLYRERETLPTFHISSPLGGWDSSFKEQCRHADYIDWKDYPQQLHSISALLKQDFILDVEAKAKEEAIFKLRDNLDKKIIN